jgi:hypothetical protein
VKVTKNAEGKITSQIDIVAHSMGYAHAQGMIDYLKTQVAQNADKTYFGRFYILAPENACSGTLNKADYETVWQYGSNENDLTEDVWDKDGVAPQCPVGNIGDNRAYIPKDGTVERGFLESHTVGNYTWIFKIDNPKKEGYVTPR